MPFALNRSAKIVIYFRDESLTDLNSELLFQAGHSLELARSVLPLQLKLTIQGMGRQVLTIRSPALLQEQPLLGLGNGSAPQTHLKATGGSWIHPAWVVRSKLKSLPMVVVSASLRLKIHVVMVGRDLSSNIESENTLSPV